MSRKAAGEVGGGEGDGMVGMEEAEAEAVGIGGGEDIMARELIRSCHRILRICINI